MSDSVVFIKCDYCYRYVVCIVRTEYTQPIQTVDHRRIETTWRILECPSCNGLLLQQSIWEDVVDVPKYEITILYPTAKATLINIPVAIRKEYDITLKVQKIAPHLCAVSARRTLEAIFTHEHASGRTLEDKINNLLKSASIPPLLADVAHLGRKIGNLGAHFDKQVVTEEDISVMLEFLETIIEYLYILPAKVDTVKARLTRNL